MFSTLDANIRSAWTQALQKRIAACVASPLPPTKALAAAEAVAVQVLRDTLIAPEEPSPATSSAAPTLRPNTAAPRFGTASAAAALRSGRLGTPTRASVSGPVRSNSFSRTYAAGIGKVEADLKEEKKAAAGLQRRGSRDEVVSAFAKRGKDLTLLTEQNSLLPLVLSFLGAGAAVPFLLDLEPESALTLPFAGRASPPLDRWDGVPASTTFAYGGGGVRRPAGHLIRMDFRL